MYVDVRLTRGQLQAMLAALDCFTSDPHNTGETLWWKKQEHERTTLEALKCRFENELALLD